MTSLRPSVSDVDRSLRELDGIDDNTRGRILRHLTAQGHLHDDRDGRLFASAASPSPQLHRLRSPLAAAAEYPQLKQRINRVLASARRMGAIIDPEKPIDIHALDRQLAGHRDIDQRFWLKSELHQLGLIEP